MLILAIKASFRNFWRENCRCCRWYCSCNLKLSSGNDRRFSNWSANHGSSFVQISSTKKIHYQKKSVSCFINWWNLPRGLVRRSVYMFQGKLWQDRWSCVYKLELIPPSNLLEFSFLCSMESRCFPPLSHTLGKRFRFVKFFRNYQMFSLAIHSGRHLGIGSNRSRVHSSSTIRTGMGHSLWWLWIDLRFLWYLYSNIWLSVSYRTPLWLRKLVLPERIHCNQCTCSSGSYWKNSRLRLTEL